jgi:hypothetical protein
VEKSLILTSATVGYLGAQSALFALSCVAGVRAWKILRTWDFDATSPRQYANEKSAYLVSTILVFLLFFKLLLAVYLVYMIDSLTPFIKAAMCGVGVLNATVMGWELLGLKLILLCLFGLWLLVDSKDRKALDYPHVRLKFRLFLVILFLMAVELVLDFVVIFSLETQKVVSCCSVTFSNRNELGGFIDLGRSTVGTIFGVVAMLYGVFGIASLRFEKFRFIFGIASLIYAGIGLLFIIYTVSPYVYELPTHTCPFCIIQKEYGYVGYFFYTTLFLGSFYGIRRGFSHAFLKETKNSDILRSFVWSALFMILSLWYTLGYFIKNGVWL